jgi:hypothetical protein
VKAIMGLERRKGHKKFMYMSKRKWTIGKFKLFLVWRKSLGDDIPCFIFSTLSHFCEQFYLKFPWTHNKVNDMLPSSLIDPNVNMR